MISNGCQGLQSPVSSSQLFPEEPSCYSSRFFEADHVHRKCKEVEEESSKDGSNEEEEEEEYVHPLVKKSSTKLSKESLEMCTERLGSESGSDMSLLTLLEAHGDDNVRCSLRMRKKANRRDTSSTTTTTTYPPPLTSISGSTGLRMESYREDGRLVLRAVATASASGTTYFHAQRSQGRLKLQLVKHNNIQQNVNGDEEDQLGDENEGEEEEEGEIGMENHFGRAGSCSSSSSCKQGRRQTKDLLNWEPLWVST